MRSQCGLIKPSLLRVFVWEQGGGVLGREGDCYCNRVFRHIKIRRNPKALVRLTAMKQLWIGTTGPSRVPVCLSYQVVCITVGFAALVYLLSLEYVLKTHSFVSNTLIDHICVHSLSCSHSFTRLCLGEKGKGKFESHQRAIALTEDLTANTDIVIVSKTVRVAGGVKGGANPNDEWSIVLFELALSTATLPVLEIGSNHVEYLEELWR